MSEYDTKDAARAEDDMDSHTIHEDFDEFDEMMMGPATAKTPTFRQLHQPLKMVMVKKQNKIDGCKVTWGMPITPNFSLSHTWNLIRDAPAEQKPGMDQMMGMMQQPDAPKSSYALNAQYAHIDEKNPQEANFVLFGNLESSGRLQSVFMYNLTKWMHFRLNYFFQNSDMNMSHRSFEVDVEGNNCAHNVSVDNHVMSYNFVQTINKNLNLGFEIYYAAERNLADLNFIGKYTRNKHSFFADYSSSMRTLGFSYLLRVDPKTTLATELSFDSKKDEFMKTKATFGYRKKFKASEVKGWISSNGKLDSLFTLGSFPMNMVRLKLYAGGNMTTDKYNYGYGIVVGQEI